MEKIKVDKIKLKRQSIRKKIVDLHYAGKRIDEIAILLNVSQSYVVDVLERGKYVVK